MLPSHDGPVVQYNVTIVVGTLIQKSEKNLKKLPASMSNSSCRCDVMRVNHSGDMHYSEYIVDS